MTDMSRTVVSPMEMHEHSSGVVLRTAIIGLTAFLTLVDLFATQAILPTLTRAYGVTPAAMGLAVNASTFGMAIAGFGVALFSKRIDRRWGILASLALLSIPTALLATAPNLAVFTALRVLQGLCMASAFSLPTPVPLSPATSPAMWRATSSAAWSRPPSPTTSAWLPISTSSPRSILPEP